MSTRRTLIGILLALATVTLAGAIAVRLPAAEAEQTTPFETLRARLRTFGSLRFGATYHGPATLAREQEQRSVPGGCPQRKFRPDCALGGLFTVMGDGRMSWERAISVNVSRTLFEPPNIYRYEVGTYDLARAAPPPDVPVMFIPLFESAFSVLRSGFGTVPATAGTEASFGIDSIVFAPGGGATGSGSRLICRPSVPHSGFSVSPAATGTLST